jgi:hypothetical protein
MATTPEQMIVPVLGDCASGQELWNQAQQIPLKHIIKSVTTELTAVYPKNRMKSFWLNKPTQLLIQGQWWSIRKMQRWQVLQ